MPISAACDRGSVAVNSPYELALSSEHEHRLGRARGQRLPCLQFPDDEDAHILGGSWDGNAHRGDRKRGLGDGLVLRRGWRTGGHA